MNHTHESRILAIQKGWRVFPLVHRSRFALEQPLLHQATSSLGQIEQWQREYPGSAWALATGSQSDVFALEASCDLGVQTLRAAHCIEDSTLANALQIRFQNRIIMFFRWPNAGFPSRESGLIVPGLYLHQAGSYVVIPTVKALGMNADGFLDHDASVRDAPSWLMDYIYAVMARRESARILPFPLASTATRSVLLIFALRIDRWVCDFYAIGGGGKIAKTLTFRTREKVIALAERGGAAMYADSQVRLSDGIEKGQGTIFLNLTRAQYEKLLAA
jgi:hypothetical protein